MFFLFQSGNEIVKLDVDRANKKVKIATSKTNYAMTEAPYSSLFDKGKEKAQEAITDKLNDKDFKRTIIAAMAQQGYLLKKCD